MRCKELNNPAPSKAFLMQSRVCRIVLSRMVASVPLLTALLLVTGEALHAAPASNNQSQVQRAVDTETSKSEDVSTSARANQLFTEGKRAFNAEQFSSAAVLFEQAHQISPHPSVLYNVAVSWYYAKDLERAATTFHAALSQDGLSERQRLDGEAQLESLRASLGVVQLRQPVGAFVSVGHVKKKPIPATLFLKPGQQTLRVDASDGATTEVQVTTQAGKTISLKAAIPNLTPISHWPPQLRALDFNVEASSAVPTQEYLGWAALGLGLVGVGGWFFLRLDLERDAEAYNASTDRLRSEFRDLRDREVRSNVLLGTSSGVGLVGAGLLLSSPRIRF